VGERNSRAFMVGDTMKELNDEEGGIRLTIDDYDKVLNSEHKGYYVTLYIDGREYIGTLRLYKDEEGKVIE
tara:strand:- start:368 stop:580 length:213 start_codon:yes stop_codon:yes gene_type:complete